MKRHALAQLEPPACATLNRLPTGCKRRFDGHVLTAPHQPFIDVVQKSENRGGIDRMRVHGLWIGGDGKGEFFGRHGHGKRAQQRGSG